MQTTTHFDATPDAPRFRSRFATALFATMLAVALLTPGDASAQFRVCNRTAESISVAMAYRSGGDWITRGWFNTSPGECLTPVSGPLEQRYYYVYGESSTGTWAGSNAFCTDSDEAFRYVGRLRCGGARQEKASFFEVDTGLSLSYTLNLRPSRTTQDTHDGIAAVRVGWRGSFAIENTWVMRLHNDTGSSISFTVRCYTKNGGYSQTFPVTIAAYGSTEIGFLEGWVGNFIAGEWCNAYHGDELVWRANAGQARNPA